MTRRKAANSPHERREMADGVQDKPNVADDPNGQSSGPVGVEIERSEKTMDDKTGLPREDAPSGGDPANGQEPQAAQATLPAPTVGRIVHYRPTHRDQNPDDSAVYAGGVTHEDVLAALIVRVNKRDGTCNLHVFTDGGGITHKHDVAQGDGEGQWNWPARA